MKGDVVLHKYTERVSVFSMEGKENNIRTNDQQIAN